MLPKREAAAIFCQHYHPSEGIHANSRLPVGSEYMVVDMTGMFHKSSS